MRLKHLCLFLFLTVEYHSYTGCSANNPAGDPVELKTGTEPLEDASLPGYDLAHPTVIKLPEVLNEISGIAFYPKDTSIFSITDESGFLYKIYLNRNYQVQSWRFDKTHDFEDLVLRDSVFYVLVSNGDIEELTFNGNVVSGTKVEFPGGGHDYEFETLYHDDTKGLVLICKQCKEDDKETVSAYGFDPLSKLFTPATFNINVLPVSEQTGLKKLKLKPSAAAINPFTDELYILCSVNKLLVVASREGVVKKVYNLDGKIYKQPEGIAFTPAGHMIISNEFNEEGSANLLILKRK